jgi:hypothetical protein
MHKRRSSTPSHTPPLSSQTPAHSDLKKKLPKADPLIRQYIAELEKRNGKLQLQIIRLEADKLERDNRIRVLEEDVKRPEVKINITGIRPDPTTQK